MAISWVGAGALLNFSSNVQYGAPYAAPVPFPATVSAGNLAILEVTSKPYYPGVSPSIVNTPAGWTVLATAYGGGYGATEQAINTGNVGYTLFYKVLAGTEGGTTVTVNVDDINAGLARIYVASNATGAWNVSAIAGEIAANAASTNVTSTFSSGFSPATGDLVLYGLTHSASHSNGGADYSAQSLTQTGTTFAASTEIGENSSSSYNRVGSLVCRTGVTAGGGTVAPTMAFTMYATASGLERGPSFAVLLHEVTPSTSSITGTSALTFSSSANLLGKHAGSISGTSALTFTGSATLTTRVAMVGTSALTFRVERGFPDRSWTATATGARKSAQAGYIDPVYFANHQNHKGCAIFEVSAIGSVDFYVERVLGETGSISTTISTFDVLTGGARAGTHYTAVSQVVTYTDGEIGWKKVNIPVTAIPTGFGVIGLQLSNYIPDGTGTARNEYCYIWLQGTGTVAGAKHLLSLGAGVESNGNTTGDGSAGNPWRSPSYAATQMGTSGGVLYVSDANGAYQDSGANKSSTAYGGAFIFENLCTVTNPLIVLPNPSNTGRPVFDNGLGRNYVDSGGATQFSPYLSRKGGIMCGRYASHIWMIGMDSIHGGIGGYANNYNAIHHIILWRMKSRWAAAEGSNVHNIRFDSSYDCIYDSCSVGESYVYESGGGASIWPSDTPGPYYGQIIPMNIEGCIQSFHSYGMRVIGCTMDNGQFALYQKNAPGNQGVNVGYFTYTVKHCLFKRVKAAGVFLSNAGSGSPPTLKAVIGYCVHDGNTRNGVGGKVNLVGIYMNGPASAQSDRIDVYNCVTRNNGFIGNLDADHVRYFNIISEDASSQWGSQGNGSFLSRLEYGDHCLYVRGSTQRQTHIYNGTVTYATLAAWRDVNKVGSGVTDDQVLMSEPDKNSTETTITPAYADTTAFDYRYSNTLGYAGKAVGLDFMTVGSDVVIVWPSSGTSVSLAVRAALRSAVRSAVR